MAAPLGIATYRALLGRKIPAPSQSRRSDEELVWVHATNGTRLAALLDLGHRLQSLRNDVRLLVTVDGRGFPAAPVLDDDSTKLVVLEDDQPSAIQHYLDEWAPNICLWAGGNLMPNIIAAAAARAVPMVLLDVGETDLPTRRRKWFVDMTRLTLGKFDKVMTTSAPTSEAMRRLGVADARLSVTGRLRPSVAPQPCSESELTSLTQKLSSRPVWLAAHVQASEFASVIEAHHAALRLIHRLLLVIVPEHENDADQLADMLAASNLRFMSWEKSAPIEDHKQVLIAPDPANMGLWYRAAPLTFMAGSLEPGVGGHSPLEAAALGSAILYGPNISAHLESYTRLAAGGAAHSVHDGPSLGAAVLQMIAPDTASAMALAGWEVVTEGAELTDRLLDLIQDTLDFGQVPDARP
ncbi:3-deoxy-D-manno-octulosonic acid transferase [Pontibaca salina]|uniref:3-deoxy-D-manno-octulosonic acid transferase n=1 Tax=Pontibaca salina TaxID=2795731 RepID=A0A934HS27_9RHOB|nr:glycosyltransferase N-terminal domain-containing protein [Pontibaca salina]MBI6629645.1 3-deoxy-D-manno-octulosonic acid transferase [Pontibaca salina]